MYNEHFEINKNFQSSINLELDLESEAKIYEYVPTTDICDVLKKYLRSVLGRTKERATTLVGPYGKGKSFLLLVLTYILSKNKDSKCWNDLAKRIRGVDKELYDLMVEAKNKDVSLLTVIINSNYENLEQSFMLALSDALKKEGMDSIIPKTAFTVALEQIESWKSDSEISNDIKDICLKQSAMPMPEIVRGLENYSKDAYDAFCKIYYCITRGVTFNPFINGDIVKTYSDVAYQSHSFGYSGLFVVFDEFSKFIESTTADVSKGLKLIQDLAEKCTRTSEHDQVHLCCVTHKNLSLYKTSKKDSFKAVEGRFTEVRFNRSLEENYQIISAAIIKKPSAAVIARAFFENHAPFYRRIDDLGIFSDSEEVCNGIFPLNPLTAYSLIQLSELVAQNERTLYTFLSDTDDNSFNSFINNMGVSDGLFNVDKIYDYFSELLQKEEANYIRNIWYRAESILSKLDSFSDKKIVKALAIILMINDFDKLPPTEEFVSLALMEPLDSISGSIQRLIDGHFLRKNILNNLLSFALSNTKQIDDRIAVLSKTKFKIFDESRVCNLLNDRKFSLPRKHNEERKITRFFKVIYMTEGEFESLADFNILFESNYCDGVVLNLLRYSLSEERIAERVSSIGNERVVVCYPRTTIDPVLRQELLRFACLHEIETEASLDEISKEEINLLMEETSEDIRVLFGRYFEADVKIKNCKFENESLSLMLSQIMDEYYPTVLVFNNELVNKRELSKQYQKAVNNVIDILLSNGQDSFSPTSPEASVRRSVIDANEGNPEFRSIIDSIKDKLLSLEGEKRSFAELFGYLQEAPFGIRKGILPILIAKAISELNDDRSNVLLYYEKKEIMLDSVNLVKAIGKDSYFLSSLRGSAEQKRYLDGLMTLFNVASTNSTRVDTVALASSIRKFFMGQPSIVRACKTVDFLMLGQQLVELKNSFLELSLNPHEVIFVRPLSILGTENYGSVLSFFRKTQRRIDESVAHYKAGLINAVKSIFGIDQRSSLKTGLTEFLRRYAGEHEKLLLSDEDKTIEDVIRNKTNYDDSQTIDELARACIGNQIEDWEKDASDEFAQRLIHFREDVSGAGKLDLSAEGINRMLEEDSLELDGIAALLSNSVENAIEEFSDSVSNADKVKILTRILKKYL